MAWIEYHEALRHHWKIKRLADRLKVIYATALGNLSCLWLWAVSNAPKGDLERFTDLEICDAMRMKMPVTGIKKVLQECELLDNNFKIHDWRKHGISLLESHRKSQRKYRKSLSHRDITVKSPLSPTDLTNRTNLTKPTIEDIRAYFLEKKSNQTEADKFFHFYESNGWKVGKNPMKNWKAAASGWLSRQGNFKGKESVEVKPKVFMRKCPGCTKQFPEGQEREYSEHLREHDAERFTGTIQR